MTRFSQTNVRNPGPPAVAGGPARGIEAKSGAGGLPRG
jgi:hypothetical protein